MNKYMKQFLAIALIVCLFGIHPVFAATDGADGFDRNASEWRRGSSDIRNKIEDLDSDRVEEFAIPVLFGVALRNITQNFGDPRASHTHEGLDIMAPEGTPIVTPTDAVVIRMGVWEGAGNFVMTAVPGEETHTYMHLSRVADIDEGDMLETGDIIGYVGHTGNAIASAPHLHFEVRDEDGTATDPYPRITEVFDLDDKIDYLKVILDDENDADELADFLVTKFRNDFVTAQTEGIELPDDIEDVLKKGPAPVVTVVAGSSTGTLRVGSRGPEVVTLQTFLLKKGVGTASRIKPDGAFGPITRQALIDYQKSAGLSADGVYGPKSRAYVLAHS